MADYDDDYVEYNPDYYEGGEDNIQEDQNFEDMFNNAQTEEDYLAIINSEEEKTQAVIWTFKSYASLCNKSLGENSFEKFKESFEKMLSFINRIESFVVQESIREISMVITEKYPSNILEIYDFMLDLMIDRIEDVEIVNIGKVLVKAKLEMRKYDELGKLFKKLFPYLEKIKNLLGDEPFNINRLELIIAELKYYNIIHSYTESKKLYLEAIKLKAKYILSDPILNFVIDEEGGKLFLWLKDYSKAFECFKAAFFGFRNSLKTVQAVTTFKYLILVSIICQNTKDIGISIEDIKKFENDSSLNAMLDLYDAYNNKDIEAINTIWNERISKYETDDYMLRILREILHNVRADFICYKIKAFRGCKFSTLQRDLTIEKEDLISLLSELILSDHVKAHLNLVEEYIRLEEAGYPPEEEYKYSLNNMNKWIASIYSSGK